MNFSARIEKAKTILKDQSVEAICFTDLSNIFYLSGFRGSDGLLLLTDDRAHLLVDGRYQTQAREQSPDCDVFVYSEKTNGLTELLLQVKPGSVGFESKKISVFLFDQLRTKNDQIKWKAIDDPLIRMRSQKDEDELTLLRKANSIADQSFSKLISEIKEGWRESDVALELEYLLRRNGAESSSFPILVASGDRTALPHASPSNKKINHGDFCFIDFGCTLDGYQTDQTVSFSMGEPKSKKLREVFDHVKEAHDRAIASIHLGQKTRELDRVARDYLRSKGFDREFSHSLGHGIGIDVHEFPSISNRLDDELLAGMAFTIEPGVYLGGTGGVRIEDAVVLHEGHIEILTNVDKAFRKL